MTEENVNRPIRITFFIPSLSDGGAQVQCARLATALQKHQGLIIRLVTRAPGVHDHLVNETLIHHEMLPKRNAFDPRAVLDLTSHLRRNNTDILVTWLHASDVIGFLATRCTNVRTRWVMTERDSRYPRQFRFWLRKFAGNHADLIIANSNAGRAYWENSRSQTRTVVIGNISPVRQIEKPFDPPQIVSVGRLEEQKRPLQVAEAIAAATVREGSIHAAIIGDGSLRERVEEVIAGYSRIRCVGFQPDATPFIAGARVLVSLSKHEGMPNVVLEAIANETIPVLSRIPEHIEVVGNEYPFFVNDPYDTDEASERILEASRTPFSSIDLSLAKARLAAMAPDRIAEAYITELRDILRLNQQ